MMGPLRNTLQKLTSSASSHEPDVSARGLKRSAGASSSCNFQLTALVLHTETLQEHVFPSGEAAQQIAHI